ncbi:hypothetical protein M758_UG221800 [Ceratodon purpureus]|nr:hypothetical protein M758_UG221800 [Ceratodon purpureus]
MYKVPLQVPRVFYLNTQASNTEEYPGIRVTRTLPHGRPVFNLIEVVSTRGTVQGSREEACCACCRP